MSALPDIDSTVTPRIDYQPRTRLIHGPGTLQLVGEVCESIAGRRVLLITDQGLRCCQLWGALY